MQTLELVLNHKLTERFINIIYNTYERFDTEQFMSSATQKMMGGQILY